MKKASMRLYTKAYTDLSCSILHDFLSPPKKSHVSGTA